MEGEKIEEFKERFLKLLNLIIRDGKQREKILNVEKIEESHKNACEIVGHVDFDLYKEALEMLFKKSENGHFDEDSLLKASGGEGYFTDTSSLWRIPNFSMEISSLLDTLSQQYNAGVKLRQILDGKPGSDPKKT